MNLPEGTRLAYVASAEAYYASSGDKPELWVSASHRDGGGAWSFVVEQHQFGREEPVARVCVFHDGFAAFAQVPEFFAALAESGAVTLADVRRVLDNLGAADETQRHRPGEKTASARLQSDIARILDHSAGRRTGEVARDILGVLGQREPEADSDAS